MTDIYGNATGLESPAIGAFAITPSDSFFAQRTRGIWVGVGGSINVEFQDGTTVVLTAIGSGTLLPLRARRVLASSTTATGLVGLY
jgi:hypothetical protein